MPTRPTPDPDPLEPAVVDAAARLGVTPEQLRAAWSRYPKALPDALRVARPLEELDRRLDEIEVGEGLRAQCVEPLDLRLPDDQAEALLLAAEYRRERLADELPLLATPGETDRTHARALDDQQLAVAVDQAARQAALDRPRSLDRFSRDTQRQRRVELERLAGWQQRQQQAARTAERSRRGLRRLTGRRRRLTAWQQQDIATTHLLAGAERLADLDARATAITQRAADAAVWDATHAQLLARGAAARLEQEARAERAERSAERGGEHELEQLASLGNRAARDLHQENSGLPSWRARAVRDRAVDAVQRRLEPADRAREPRDRSPRERDR